MPSKSPPVRVAVSGLGLIGASLAAALRAAGGWHVTGFDADAQVAEAALRAGHVDRLGASLDAACREAELIVLATPVGVILEELGRLAQVAADGATIIDVGSTKRAVHDAMNRLPERLRAVGGHPMAGRRSAGVTGASPDLFRNRKFVLVPNDRSDDVALSLTRRAIADLGASAVQLDADRHDRIVALVSHVPRYLGVGLLAAARRSSDDMVWQLAAGGFRAATSMTGDSVDMWRDIGVSNGANIAAGLRQLAAELESLAELLDSGDGKAIHAALADLAGSDQLSD